MGLDRWVGELLECCGGGGEMRGICVLEWTEHLGNAGEAKVSATVSLMSRVNLVRMKIRGVVGLFRFRGSR